ncbi:hypothetical protein [Actinokineospora iranica]|uniref:Methylmalonyl-CoA mutase, C-terminal domain n=1 Tax=Actinokineospora iranica TaxID=1271860 RepID=A0A1G6SI86_9PSEU|nr:hypothetical protein [Actinokineospora iranica]SDD16612.1 methylmalonyl-CoA mutase, C-terminal domain [Actinokineospora iranica]
MRRVRIVLAELGPGERAQAVARDLRDAGAEVIYTGRLTGPAHVVGTALQEDADAIAVDEQREAVASLLSEQDAPDVEVLGFDTVLDWASEAGREARHGR